jgi:hypothetical protein
LWDERLIVSTSIDVRERRESATSLLRPSVYEEKRCNLVRLRNEGAASGSARRL